MSVKLYSISQLNEERERGSDGKRLYPEEPRICNFDDLDPKPGKELPLLRACHRGNLSQVIKLVTENPKVLEERDDKLIGPLGMAMIFGHFEVAYWLGENGACVTDRDHLHNTALCYAVFLRSPSLVELFIDKGADTVEDYPEELFLNARCLHLAMLTGRTDIVQMLIDKGADMSRPVRAGPNPLWSAAVCDRLEAFKWALKQYPHLLSVRESNTAWHLFHGAVKYGALRIVQWMTKKGTGDLRNPVDSAYPNALHLAAECGAFEICRWITQNHKDLNTPNDVGLTPFLRAAAEGKIKCLKMMAEIEGYNVICRKGANAMIWASGGGHINVVKHLESKGLSIYTCPGHVWAPIHRAAANNQAALVDWLLNRGVDVDLVESQGYTSFHLATLFGRMDVAELLLARGANIRAKTNSKLTAAQLSMHELEFNSVKFLWSLDPNLFHELSEPYWIPASQGCDRICQFLFENGVLLKPESLRNAVSCCAGASHINMLRWLHQHGVSMNPANATSAIHAAVKKNQPKVIRFLIDELQMTASRSPSDARLCWTAYDCHASIELLQLLIEMNHSVNCNGAAYIHRAAKLGKLQDLKWFYNHGFYFHVPNTEDFTPLYYAVKYGHVEVAKWLLAHGTTLAHKISLLQVARSNARAEMVQFLNTQCFFVGGE